MITFANADIHRPEFPTPRGLNRFGEFDPRHRRFTYRTNIFMLLLAGFIRK
jgi:hypothetical protein